jgi:hypothetical protein
MKAMLRRFPAPSIDGPDFALESGSSGALLIPPTRKDGLDYRMGWRTFEEARVTVTNLPQPLYEWAERFRGGLAPCWEAGRVAPRAPVKSD